MSARPCPCWWLPAALHGGQCCMTTENREKGCHAEMVERVKAERGKS